MMTYVNEKTNNILLSCQMALGKWLSRVLQAWVKNIEEEQSFHKEVRLQSLGAGGRETGEEREDENLAICNGCINLNVFSEVSGYL